MIKKIIIKRKRKLETTLVESITKYLFRRSLMRKRIELMRRKINICIKQCEIERWISTVWSVRRRGRRKMFTGETSLLVAPRIHRDMKDKHLRKNHQCEITVRCYARHLQDMCSWFLPKMLPLRLSWETFFFCLRRFNFNQQKENNLNVYWVISIFTQLIWFCMSEICLVHRLESCFRMFSIDALRWGSSSKHEFLMTETTLCMDSSSGNIGDMPCSYTCSATSCTVLSGYGKQRAKIS
jgi:hypothetical protein